MVVIIKVRFIFSLIFLFMQGLMMNDSLGYVRSKGAASGVDLSWDQSVIELHVLPANTQNLNKEQVFEIIKAAADEWNTNSSLKISLITDSSSYSGSGSNLRNEIYFAGAALFSQGILGTTSLVYDEITGKLVEGDILLNDSISFVLTPSESESSGRPYLGDVITHEMGHLWGLGHSQFRDSSMLYATFRGQSSLSLDDYWGMNAIKSKSSGSNTGVIRGKVIGSKDLIAIFASQVYLISEKSGKVLFSLLTNEDGRFEVSGLPLDDTYYIYVAPPFIRASLPDFYLSGSKNFCLNGDYRGSFFTKCSADAMGMPQGIYLSDSEKVVDVGLISIKCQMDLSQSYLGSKDYSTFQSSTTYTVPLNENSSGWGNAIIGSFSTLEIRDEVADKYTIDLRSYNVSSMRSAQDELYLELKMISQDLYSPFRGVIQVIRNEQSIGIFPNATGEMEKDNDGNYLLDVLARVPLSALAEENIFEVSVTPKSSPGFLLSGSASELQTLTKIFPSYAMMMDLLSFYLFLVNVSKKNKDGSYTIIGRKDHKRYDDNHYCADASKTYPVIGISSQKKSAPAGTSSNIRYSKRDSSIVGIAGCGSIVFGPPGGGSGNGGGRAFTTIGVAALAFLLTLFVYYLLSYLRPVKNMTFLLSKRAAEKNQTPWIR
ncbi:MAG: matrixin family metalloprotease [Oligoflexia bacterium]|nr:matrixin family metalloprotease [Oligoflexia bacterium]